MNVEIGAEAAARKGKHKWDFRCSALTINAYSTPRLYYKANF